MIAEPVGAAAVAALRTAIAGRVVTPADADYDDARAVWNGMIDKRPALIVQAAATDDIATTIGFARANDLRLAVRGGGHNVAGNGTVEGGVVLDLGRLNGVEVDAASRLVRIGPGATLGDIDRATEPHDLVVPVGVVSGTGIAGLTLGGGVGWLVRRYGLTIDNLVAADVVLATGEQVTASEEEHPDLFWGLRGGGGNFGVVSSFTFRAYPLNHDVFAGTLVYEQPKWRDALASFARLAPDLPDDLTVLMTLLVPPADWELGDRPLLLMGFAWAGPDRAEGEAVIGRIRDGCEPDVSVLDPTRWLTFQTAFDVPLAKGSRAYWRNASFERFDEPLIETLAAWSGRQRYGTAVDIHHMGGAYGRVPEDATAYPTRAAEYLVNIYGFWSDPAEDAERIAWVKGFSNAIDAWSMVGQYVNFLGQDEADARAKGIAAYGAAKYERLVSVKRRYDPGNVFRINHNIVPD